jgi:hypothetical protein
MDVFDFPPELVNPKDKEKASYGVAYAKAAYYNDNRYGQRLFGQDDEYDSLVEIAQGRQSVSNLKKIMGFHFNDGRENPDGPASMAYIDPQVLNLAPKYVNRGVAKMQANHFDIGLDAIDLVSMDAKKDAAAIIKTFYRMKDWVKQFGLPLQSMFESIDVASLPQYPDQLLYDLNTNPKLKTEIGGEMALKMVMEMNNFNQKMRQVDWDLVVIGRGHLHLYLDANNIPRVERINPKFWGGSYVENDDFEQQEYAYFLDCISANQFIREASPYYSQEELIALIKANGIRNSSFNPGDTAVKNLNSYDNLVYIPVMRFYFRSEDNRTFVTRKNRYGSKTIMEKGFNYKPSEGKEDRYSEGGDSKIYKNTYTSIYGGTWIIDSECCYDYGLKRYPRTNMVDATLPIKTFATNYKEGRSVSFVSQMIEPLFMINVAWNKIKTGLAKEWSGVREIDFNQIANVAMGNGGNEWTSRDVMKFLEMTNTLIKRGNQNPNAPADSNALKYHNSGVLLADNFTALQLGINMLEQMTSTTLVESAKAPDRLAVGVMKQSQIVGDLDMEYLHNGHEYLYKRTAHQMMLLIQQAKRDKAKIKGFMPSLGEMFDIPDDIAYCDLGIVITRQPSPEEWAMFYNDMSIALKEGRISVSDSAFVREIDNLKQARQVLMNRETQYQRQQIQAKQMDIQANMQANMQSAEAKMQADMMKIQAETAAKSELIKLQGMIDQALQQEKSQQDALTKGVEMEMKKLISKQQGVDGILKQAMKNSVDKMKVERLRVGQNA